LFARYRCHSLPPAMHNQCLTWPAAQDSVPATLGRITSQVLDRQGFCR
jgi:hypothetical protein